MPQFRARWQTIRPLNIPSVLRAETRGRPFSGNSTFDGYRAFRAPHAHIEPEGADAVYRAIHVAGGRRSARAECLLSISAMQAARLRRNDGQHHESGDGDDHAAHRGIA